MRISELAARAGVAPSVLRWYETVGALPQPERRPNGYRAYREGDLARVRLLVSLRRLGLSIEEAARLAAQCLEQEVIEPPIETMVEDQLAKIRGQRDELDRLEGELLDLRGTAAAAGRQSRRTVMTARPIRVLFVCTHNSARSQIAEAMLGWIGGQQFEVHSAGTEVSRVNPLAIRVLAEQGIDWTSARSKSVTEFLGQDFDYVITVCDRARETCPVLPGALNTLHWGLDDPSEVQGTEEERLAAFRRTLAEVVARLRPFVEIARRSHRPASSTER